MKQLLKVVNDSIHKKKYWIENITKRQINVSGLSYSLSVVMLRRFNAPYRDSFVPN